MTLYRPRPCSDNPNSIGRGWRIPKALLVLFTVALAAACSRQEPSWNSTAIGGVMPDLSFQLIDSDGHAVAEDRFKGDPLLMYFGFTHCPHLCPTTLATLSAAVREAGPDAKKVRVLFVSVDPRRDTPERLKAYAARFGNQVVGLTGDMPQLKALAKRYRVAFGYGKPDANGDYAVDHSNAIFAFDSAGKARLLMREDSGVPALASDIRRLAQQ